MTLQQLLAIKPLQPYAVFFSNINEYEIIEALARAEASAGTAADAMEWADQIGSGMTTKTATEAPDSRVVYRRIIALIGVAEGAMERAGIAVPKPGE